MENEGIELIDDIAKNVGEASDALSELQVGSEERMTEAKIYDMQTKTLLGKIKQDADYDFEQQRLGLERYKIDEELKIRREIEEARLAIETKKANNEIYTMWGKLAFAGAELVSGIGLGLLYLKANLKYGGMIGKDAKKIFDDLKHIKL